MEGCHYKAWLVTPAGMAQSRMVMDSTRLSNVAVDQSERCCGRDVLEN